MVVRLTVCRRLQVGQHLGPPIEHAFVEHPSDVTVTRHASSSGTANLRHAANGLRFVLRDDFANFAFRYVQTMTEGPMSFGGCLSVSRTVRVTEIHD